VNRLRTIGLVAAALALVAGAVITARPTSARAAARQYDIAAERALRDADIAFFQKHAARDPTGALDHLHLAALYLQRARERSTPADLGRAEAEARQSLANRRAHNSEAWHELALALVGQHKFIEARECAESLLAADPAAIGPRSLVGEIDLELGRYLEADTIFSALDRPGAEPPVLARVARWASLRGHSEHAWALLLSARDKAHHRGGTPAEQLAWYDLRLGEMALATGRLGDAGTHLAAAREIIPDDPRVLLALSRMALAKQRPKQALDYANDAMNAGEDPLAFALASDAQLRLGHAALADRMFRAFETAITAAPPSAWHRQWRLELLDHGEEVAAVLEQARDELTTRPDVYGWDQYAWALHRTGRDAEARVAMGRALQWGTEDVMLDAHAAALAVRR
jgi:tetratricopeptide (TPR) repeat protein